MKSFVRFFLLCVVFSSALSFSPRVSALTINLEKTKNTAKKPPSFKTPVILDVRKSFDYSMNHAEGALPINWEDYAQTEDPHKGSLDPDFSLLARRLRVFGIFPGRQVIVYGKGENGGGEEGRIAWMLYFLGVKNVEVLGESQLAAKKVFGERPDVEAAPLWLPEADESIRIKTSELEKLISLHPENTALIDVRSPEEFSGKKTFGEKRPGHIPGAINIFWREFASKDSIADRAQIVEALKKRGISETSTLLFYCTSGVRSAFATFAALKSNLKAKNYDGSLMEWSSDVKRPVTF